MTLRVGVIGVGRGAHVQVPGFRAAAGYDPVAMCARTPERLHGTAAKLGAHRYESVTLPRRQCC
jgi:predicted dehydrogenase